ncbi:hypothetical protein KSF_099580 [Reticulibacter mediterranei]|uniref:Uncharacterized protein n=1 Tax=Reticulibacter mediterranei TaxID=2778369 RepID=A0A8J3N8U6_9CHLR|nr:hypothetical protein [Reticulibacter mediterranei]GHO99910.1 hypothetical protein KSF_099580 [Reticulibacter mediterranei]
MQDQEGKQNMKSSEKLQLLSYFDIESGGGKGKHHMKLSEKLQLWLILGVGIMLVLLLAGLLIFWQFMTFHMNLQ